MMKNFVHMNELRKRFATISQITTCGILLLTICAISGFGQKVEKSKVPKDRQFKIVEKPHPRLPDNARGVRGWVRIKVELLKDSTVGRIWCINEDNEERRKLERAGIVDATMKAAKAIKFKPRIVNGEPVSVIVSLDYLFNMGPI